MVGADGPSLLGTGSKVSNLTWHESVDWMFKPAESVLQRHSNVFQELHGPTAGIPGFHYVDPTARPRFFRPHPVPCSMRSLIEHKLERLVHLQVPVQFAECAAPIVPV